MYVAHILHDHLIHSGLSISDVPLRLSDTIYEFCRRSLLLSMIARRSCCLSPAHNQFLGNEVRYHGSVTLFNYIVVIDGVRLIEYIHEPRTPANRAVQILASLLLLACLVEQLMTQCRLSWS